VNIKDHTRPILVRLGSTMDRPLPERIAYVMALARVFIASPEEEREPWEEGGLLWGVLVSACERLGLEPQVIIDAAIDDARAISETGDA
jgi:hypothetical protein